MRMVVGLGNPGKKYQGTRHNIGFEVVDRLAGRHGLAVSKKGFSSLWAKGEVGGSPVLLLKPQTYMNLSGRAVREALDYHRLSTDDLAVAHDEIDLPLGRLKWVFEAGTAGNRGVTSIVESLGTKAFYRVRVGIGRPERKEDVENYVLSPFAKNDRETVEAMTKEAVELLEKWIQQ